MRREMTYEEWLAEGERRFGPDLLQWRFVCPACGHVQSAKDYRDAKAPESAVGFSCVGRWLPGCRNAFSEGTGPCNYAGGGLIGLNPIRVLMEDGKTIDAFDFAETLPAAVPAAG